VNKKAIRTDEEKLKELNKKLYSDSESGTQRRNQEGIHTN
jgi:hypothetical protein